MLIPVDGMFMPTNGYVHASEHLVSCFKGDNW